MKRIIALILLIITAASCAACQPTPEKSAVQSKANNEFEKALDAAPTAAVIETDKAVHEEYAAKDENVTITISAKTNAPDGIENIEVPEVIAYRFDNDFVKKSVKVFFDDMQAYDYPKEYTKELIRAQMQRLEEYMSDGHLEKYNEDTREKLLISYQRQYDELRKLIKTAPDNIEKKKSDLKLKPWKYFVADSDYKEWTKKADGDELSEMQSDEPRTFRARAYDNDGYIYDLSMEMTTESSSYKYASMSFTKSKYYYGTYGQYMELVPITDYGTKSTGGETAPCTIQEEQAKKMAEELLEKLGLSDYFAVTLCKKQHLNSDQEFYEVICSRQVGEIIMEKIPQGGEDIQYRPHYEEERLHMIITDDGVDVFSYTFPLKIQRIVNKGVGIKSFDEIFEIYREQSALTYDTIYDITQNEEGKKEVIKSTSANVEINDISFKVMRIAEKDKALTYLLAPVWSFSGKITYYTADNTPMFSADTSIMINAIDGSIISAEDCY